MPDVDGMPSLPALHHWPHLLRLTALAAVVGLCVCLLPTRADADAPGFNKTNCMYSGLSISTLNSFESMVGTQINCVQVYVDATTTWEQWETPWIDTNRTPDNDWVDWINTPGTNRQMIITQDLIPSGVANTDWLDEGAAGDFEGYAKTFAQNLINAGFGNAVIRLAPEANGNWFYDSYGSTAAQWAQWVQFWRNTVLAMKSVPGAHFSFDWCINYLYRNLPLSQIYPGNDVVDIIGIDVYDDGNLGSTGAARWDAALTRPDGVQSVLAFAQQNGKPLSIPEWGVDTTSAGGGGDDPDFVNGIARVVANNDVAYQSYFYRYGHLTQLAPGTNSLSAFQAAFGAGGYALGLPSTLSPVTAGTTTVAPTSPVTTIPVMSTATTGTATTPATQPTAAAAAPSHTSALASATTPAGTTPPAKGTPTSGGKQQSNTSTMKRSTEARAARRRKHAARAARRRKHAARGARRRKHAARGARQRKHAARGARQRKHAAHVRRRHRVRRAVRSRQSATPHG